VNATDRRYSAVAFGNEEECFDRARAKIATVAVPAGDLSLSYHHVVGAVAIFNHQVVIAEGTFFPQGARCNTFTLSGQTFLLAGADPGAHSEIQNQKQRQSGEERYGVTCLSHDAQCTAKVTDR
jgi:hypothetical protein